MRWRIALQLGRHVQLVPQGGAFLGIFAPEPGLCANREKLLVRPTVPTLGAIFSGLKA